jgi:ankyrin repeat protein
MYPTFVRLIFVLFLVFTPSVSAAADSGTDAALIKATKAGDLTTLGALIDGGANVDIKTADGTPALMLAVRTNQYDAFSALIEAGAEIDLTAADGDTAVNWAAKSGQSKFVDMLLRRGASTQIGSHGTARQLAMRRGHQQIILMLARYDGVPVPNPDAALLADAISANDIEGVREALLVGISANSLDFTGRPVLSLAGRLGNTEIITQLLSKGAKIDAIDEIGFTAIMEAARARRWQAAETLLSAGANPYLSSPDGFSAAAEIRSQGPDKLQAMLTR